MWVEHIKCELIEAYNDPLRFNKLLDALVLMVALGLMPEPIEEDIFGYLDELANRAP